MKNILLLLSLSILTLNAQTLKSELKIVNKNFLILNTKQKLFGKVSIKDPFLGSKYVLFNDSLKYSLNEIRELNCDEGYFVTYNSFFYGTGLARRVVIGKIELFQDSKTYFSPGTFNTINTGHGSFQTYAPGPYNSISYDYFRKNGGELLEADYSNLSKMLADNPVSKKLLSEYNTLNWVKWGCVTAGLGIIIAALANADEDTPPQMGTMLLGGVVANAAWIPHLMQRGKLIEAIRIYNE